MINPFNLSDAHTLYILQTEQRKDEIDEAVAAILVFKGEVFNLDNYIKEKGIAPFTKEEFQYINYRVNCLKSGY